MTSSSRGQGGGKWRDYLKTRTKITNNIVMKVVYQNYSLQWNPDLVNVNLVNFPDLVNFFGVTTLLVVWSKITIKIVNNPDLVNILLLTKKFTKSGVYCNCIIINRKVIFLVNGKKKFYSTQGTLFENYSNCRIWILAF